MKGFIFIVLGFSAVSLAGTSGYLPNVGPMALRFEPVKPARSPVVLPMLPPVAPVVETEKTDQPEPGPTPAPPVENKLSGSETVAPPAPTKETIVVSTTNVTGPLIGPMAETNGVVSPQVFLRYFTPLPDGGAREAVVLPATGFSPALPPPASSTAVYQQSQP